MKTFNDFLIESLNETDKKYSFTDQEYQDWVDLKKGSTIVKKIEDYIETLQHETKETAYCAYNDNAEEYEGGKLASYDSPFVDLEMNKVKDWCEDLEIEDFRTDYILEQGKDGLQKILNMIIMFDRDYEHDPEEVLGEVIYNYYKVCHGLSDSEYKRKVNHLTVEYCKQEDADI